MKDLMKALRFHDQAITLARDVKSRPLEAEILLNFATMKRRTGMDLCEVTASVEQSISIFDEGNDLSGLCRCWCELGHVHLAENQSAKLCLSRAQQIYDQVALHKNVQLQTAMMRLMKAQQFYSNGDHHLLSYGELQEHLPISLRNGWSTSSGVAVFGLSPGGLSSSRTRFRKRLAEEGHLKKQCKLICENWKIEKSQITSVTPWIM